MPSFSPTVIIHAIPAIAITGGNVTYSEVKQSLGDWVYFVKTLYFNSNLFNQIKGVLGYQHKDANGNQVIESMVPSPDPYQYQNSLFYNTQQFDVILDGQSNFKFNMLPNSTLKLQLFSNRLSKRDALDIISPNNFKTLESAMGEVSFFEDFTDKI